MSEEASASNAESKPVVEGDEEAEDQGVTMLDVLEEEQDLEQDADAVLGGSDDQNCTYSKGYVTRQALYTCLTCIPVDAEKPVFAGVCLACSYNCHEGHELVELYTKRNFKCDCGNSKFGDKKCNLEPEKDAENTDNQYNQNFQGVYCTCGRPYPDPEDTIEDEMIQCIGCEDWFHGRHLDLPVQAPLKGNNFSEMICGACMEKHTFLWHYSDEFGVSSELADVSVDVEDVAKPEATNGTSKEPSTTETKTETDSKPTENADEGKVAAEEEATEVKVKTTEVKKEDEEAAAGPSQPKSSECYLKNKAECETKKMATFWSHGWRKQLCTCQQCKDLYETHKLSFLLDESDMVQAYEEAGKEKIQSRGTRYEQGMQALSSMDRVSQVEAIQEYNQMKVELKEFLAQFAATKRVVREEDIKEFFEDLKARKRRRVEGGVPHFCH